MRQPRLRPTPPPCVLKPLDPDWTDFALCNVDGVSVIEGSFTSEHGDENIANAYLLEAMPDLYAAALPIADWLSHFVEKGEQLGNLDMRHAARLIEAVERAGGVFVEADPFCGEASA